MIAGYIAERAPKAQEPEPLIAGWWTNRAAGQMFLRQATSPTMLILSAAAHHQLSGGLLLEARLKGVRRILFVAADGSIVKQVDVASALVRMLQSVSLADPMHRRLTTTCSPTSIRCSATGCVYRVPTLFLAGC